MEEKDKIVLETPKPYSELENTFNVSGWVPKSWLNPETDRRIFIELLGIDGKTIMGGTIDIGTDKAPDSKERLWFSHEVNLTFYNEPFIEKSKARIVLDINGKGEDEHIYIPVIIKGFDHSDNVEIVEKHGKVGEMISQYKEDLKKYNEKLRKIREDNRHILNTSNKEGSDIEINVTDETLAKNILRDIKPAKDVNAVLYDRAKEKHEEAILNEEYKEALEWRGRKYKGIEFFNLATYAVAWILGKWVFRHVTEDIDDKLWDKVKETAKSVFLPLKSSKKSNEKVPLVIDSEQGKKIVYLFDVSLTIEEFDEAFDLVDDSLKQLNEADKNNEVFRPLIFQYNKSKKRWEKESKT